jgi:hypothetical protein
LAFFDKTGALVIPADYEVFAGGSFSFSVKNNLVGLNGLVRVKKDKKWAFIDANGDAFLGKWYEELEVFLNKIGEKWKRRKIKINLL